MARVTLAQQSFAGGEASPAIAGRADLALYYTTAAWVQNFITTTQGEAKYRSGSKFVWNTRDNQIAVLIPFEYNTEQAYVLEFTNLKMRIHKDGGIVTHTAQVITDITNANPAVVTYTGSDTYTAGDRVIISGVVGMTEVNNLEFTVGTVDTGANTFELSGVNSSGYAAYSSAGTVAEIVEVTTPYLEAELFDINFAQTADTMYLVHPTYAPYKLTRSSHTAWTLGTYTISGNPFGTTKAASQAISGATRANPCVITYVGADTYANGDTVYISGVLGMTELNGKNFTVANVNAGGNTFELQDVDSTLFTAYGSVGIIEEYTAFSYPSVVAFFEQRLLFAASDTYQQRFWGSRAGSPDIFVTGTQDTDGFVYNIASGKVNRIRWMVGTEAFLAIGTAGGEFSAGGGGQGDAITPSNISVKNPSFYGSSDVNPIRLDSHILYIQRDEMTTRSFEFDAIQDGYTSINRNLTSDQITRGRYGTTNGIKQMGYQSGNPNIVWSVRNDGLLAGLTFEPKEQVNGWHRHIAGGTLTAGKNSKPEYGSVCTIPQTQKPHAVYTVVKRTINGATVRYVEFFADQPNIPRLLDYYTGDKDADKEAYLLDMFEAQKRLHYVDSGVTYDGTDYATQALTLSAISGDITITAGGSVFSSDMVGREIWGVDGGRATISAYSSGTVVSAEVLVDFPDTTIAASYWYLTNNEFGGAQHLIGEDLVAIADGAVLEGLSVDNLGRVTLDGLTDLGEQYSYFTIGFKYQGIWKSMDLEGGGNNGPAVTKLKSVNQVGVKFLDTLGTKCGTDIYNMEKITFRKTSDLTSRPPPLFSGTKVFPIPDSPDGEKYVYFLQDTPQPCTLQVVSPYMTTNDG